MDFFDNANNIQRRRWEEEVHLINQLHSLREDVSSSDHVDRVKDDIIADSYIPNCGVNSVDGDNDSNYWSTSSSRRSFKRKNNRPRERRSYIQLDTFDEDEEYAAAQVDVEEGEDITMAVHSESGSSRYRSHGRHNNSGSTERVRNHMHQSSETDRIQNTTESKRRRPQHQQQEQHTMMTKSERSDAVALMLSEKGLSASSPSVKSGWTNSSRRFDRSVKSVNSRGGRNFVSRRSAKSRGATSGKSRKGSSGSGSAGGEERFYSRCDLWLALATSQLIAVGSIAYSSSGGTYYYTPLRSPAETAVLALSSTSFILSFIIGMGYFHEPFRNYFTRLREEDHRNYNLSAFKRMRELITMEQLTAVFVLIIVSVSSGLILYPHNMGGGSHVAVAGNEIWNANLFYSTWIGLYGSAYLGATVTVGSVAPPGRTSRAITLWFMVAFSSICASFAALLLNSGPTCRGYVLADSTYCQSSLTAGLLSSVGALLSILYMMYLLLSIKKSQGGSLTRWISLSCSSLLLMLNSAAVGLVASPSGPGNQGGSVYVASWTTWILSLLLWKSCIEALLMSPEAPAVSTLKLLERKHRHGRHRQHDASLRSGEDTMVSDTDDDDVSGQENYALDVMEEGSSSSSDSESGTDSTPSHNTMMHCLDELSRSRDGRSVMEEPEQSQQQYPRRSIPDPDEYIEERSNYYHQSVNDNTNYSGADPGESDSYQNDAYYLEQEAAMAARASEVLGDDSGYYSGSQAVNVQTGTQEEISTLGGDTFMDATSRASLRRQWVAHHEDPGGVRGSMLPDKNRARNYMQVEPSGVRRPMNIEPVTEYNNAPSALGRASRMPSQFTSSNSDIDREWDFDNGLSASQMKAPASASPAGPEPCQGRYPRRPSRDSLMSNLSPLHEASREETSSRSKTGTISSKSSSVERTTPHNRDGSSGTRRTSAKTGAASSSKSSNNKERSRTKAPPPPPPLRPDQAKRGQGNGIYHRDSSGGSESVPVTVEEGQTRKRPSEGSSTVPKTEGPSTEMDAKVSDVLRTVDHLSSSQRLKLSPRNLKKRTTTTTAPDSDSVSTSSSDFDIVVPDCHDSVVTDLTQEGFDASSRAGNGASSTRLSVTAAAMAAAVHAEATANNKAREAAENYNTHRYLPRNNLSRQPQQDGLPVRMPLYNGSVGTASASNPSTKSPGSLKGKEVHPSVEAFLADAIKQARMSQSYGNLLDDMLLLTPTDDEEQSSVDHSRRSRAEQRRNNKGDGVNSGNFGSGGHQRRNSTNKKTKKDRSSSSSKAASHRSSKTSNKKSTATNEEQSYSEPDLRRQRETPAARRRNKASRSGQDGYATATSLHESDIERNNTTALLGNSNTMSKSSITGGRRGSMQSLFSEQDNYTLSAPGEDYVC